MTKGQVRSLLASDVAFLERMICALQRRQTADEVSARQTKHDNGKGWNATDAKDGGYYAWYINKCSRPEGQRLTGHFIEKARQMMYKYSGQCADICNGQIRRRQQVA